jgi:ATP adenylyltransferase
VRRQRKGPQHETFEPGTLGQRIQDVIIRARHAGALEPIDTASDYIEDQGLTFLVRVARHLRKKPVGTDDRNPFLPYEPLLYVADASASHACLLNKYNVIDRHLLLVTRQFEHQETALTFGDFRALCCCLGEYESLGFYNSGMRAGASQQHKHLQLVPLPLAPTASRSCQTVRSLLDQAKTPVDQLSRIDHFSFCHAFLRWDLERAKNVETWARYCRDGYQRLAQHVGIELPTSPQAMVATPYNLLVTRRWMLMVPRQRECFGEISFNALAFVGTLLVHNRDQLAALRTAGPLRALQSVCAAE